MCPGGIEPTQTVREVVSLARKKKDTKKSKGEELFCEKRKTKSKKASTKKKGDDQKKFGADFAADIQKTKNKKIDQIKKGEELFAPPPEKVSVPFTEKDRIIPTFCESPSTGKNGEIH